jgi:hypothetical protein
VVETGSNTHRVLAAKLERNANERMLLKWILKNQDDRGKDGFIWLCVRSGRILQKQ